MKPDVIVLADAGHVRDGLIYVIGGGIEQIYSPSLPAIIQATIVAKVTIERDDYGREHALSLTVRDESNETPVAQLRATFFAKEPPGGDRSPSGFATAIKLDGLALPEYGRYSMLLQVDEIDMKDFQVLLAPPSKLKRRSTDVVTKGSPDATVRPRAKRRKG